MKDNVINIVNKFLTNGIIPYKTLEILKNDLTTCNIDIYEE